MGMTLVLEYGFYGWFLFTKQSEKDMHSLFERHSGKSDPDFTKKKNVKIPTILYIISVVTGIVSTITGCFFFVWSIFGIVYYTNHPLKEISLYKTATISMIIITFCMSWITGVFG